MKYEYGVLGSTGLLGTHVSKEMRRSNMVFLEESRKTGLDISRVDDIVAKYSKGIVNCIGITRSDLHKYTKRDIHTVNTVFPLFLGEACRLRGLKLVHISTDIVFSGKRGFYSETDIPDTIDQYGLTKLHGEPTYGVILRCGFFGMSHADNSSLLNWFLQQEQSVTGHAKSLRNWVSVNELSKEIIRILNSDLSGIYHLGGEIISGYDLLRAFATAFNKTIDIIPVNEPEKDLSLDCHKYIRASGYEQKTINCMIKDMIDEM